MCRCLKQAWHIDSPRVKNSTDRARHCEDENRGRWFKIKYEFVSKQYILNRNNDLLTIMIINDLSKLFLIPKMTVVTLVIHLPMSLGVFDL